MKKVLCVILAILMIVCVFTAVVAVKGGTSDIETDVPKSALVGQSVLCSFGNFADKVIPD